MKSVCFVLTPFGVKQNGAGAIDFDSVYKSIYRPAIEAAGLEPKRSDEETAHGVVQKLMFERLLLSEYAIADLTIPNPNVFYELGIRHVAKPGGTIVTTADPKTLPFDVATQRAFVYALGPDGRPSDPDGDAAKLRKLLEAAIAGDMVDSPLYQLVDALAPPPIDRERTDVFRDHARYSEEQKARLEEARAKKTVEAVAEVEKELGPASGVEGAVMVDLMLSYRAVGGHEQMIDLARRMDRSLARSVLVREQVAFAQNRLGLSQDAEATLTAIIKERGANSETNGLLGRVYKDRWDKAVKAGETLRAKAWLKKAIGAYLEGFEADFRDAYPGINAVTLMEIADDARRHALTPIVRYAMERRLARKGEADYWDHATRLELAVLADDSEAAADALGDALAHNRETWELETTARNLRLIAQARAARGSGPTLADEMLAQLTGRVG